MTVALLPDVKPEEVREQGPPSEEPAWIPLGLVRPSESPRSGGISREHVALLAEAELPPILVHESSLRIVDGVHRLCAARLRGADPVPSRPCDAGRSGERTARKAPPPAPCTGGVKVRVRVGRSAYPPGCGGCR